MQRGCTDAARGPANELAKQPNGCADDKRLPLSSFLFTPARSSLPRPAQPHGLEVNTATAGRGRRGREAGRGDVVWNLRENSEVICRVNIVAALGRFSS